MVDVRYDYQTKLVGLEKKAAFRPFLGDVIDNQEGCFCLTSGKGMLASKAPCIYHSLKSEIEIKSVRVGTEDAVFGILLLGFIAQLKIYLTCYFIKSVKRMSMKFIIVAFKKLTVTVVSIGS